MESLRELNRTVGIPRILLTRYSVESPKAGRGTATDFKPALAIEPFASPFLGPVEPVFLEAERLVRQVA